MRDLVYYIATSADGFIADPGGGTGAFPHHPGTLTDLFERYPETCPAHLREALGVAGSPRRFDTVLMGYRTFEPARDAGLTSAYPHLREIVVTHRDLGPTHPWTCGPATWILRSAPSRTSPAPTSGSAVAPI